MLGWLECIAIAHQINYAIEFWFASYYTDMPDISMMAACCPKDLLKDNLLKFVDNYVGVPVEGKTGA